MALIAATGSASASAYAGMGDHDDMPMGDVFHPGSVARAELYIWVGSLAWLVFIGAAVQGL